MAPAVVPSKLAPRPTDTRSIDVAAMPMPRIWGVLPMDWSVVISSKP